MRDGSPCYATLRFDSGRGIDAEVVGTDPSTDLAVLRVDPEDAPPLKPLTLADSDNVTVGDNAIAIGFPLGLDRTATAGIVSGLQLSAYGIGQLTGLVGRHYEEYGVIHGR